MIKALWIDDFYNPQLIEVADRRGIYIDQFLNVDSGISELQNNRNHYDAIILDANCVSHDNGNKEPDISTLGYALMQINKNSIKQPWFVFSAGGFSGEDSIDVIVRGQERLYDDKNWYKKGVDNEMLFEKIKQVVEQSHDYQIKAKYPELFSLYPYPGKLLEIIKYLEDAKSKDANVFNIIRKEFEWITEHLQNTGYLPILRTGSNLAECSKFLGDTNLTEIIPYHIQRSFHSATSVCNEGSHRLSIDEAVTSGNAPYLVKSTIYEFLNILFWLRDIPESPEKRQETNQKVLSKMYKAHGIVSCDVEQNIYCGNVLLSKDCNELIDKYIGIKDYSDNKSQSKVYFPYYARKEQIVELVQIDWTNND